MWVKQGRRTVVRAPLSFLLQGPPEPPQLGGRGLVTPTSQRRKPAGPRPFFRDPWGTGRIPVTLRDLEQGAGLCRLSLAQRACPLPLRDEPPAPARPALRLMLVTLYQGQLFLRHHQHVTLRLAEQGSQGAPSTGQWGCRTSVHGDLCPRSLLRCVPSQPRAARPSEPELMVPCTAWSLLPGREAQRGTPRLAGDGVCGIICCQRGSCCTCPRRAG